MAEEPREATEAELRNLVEAAVTAAEAAREAAERAAANQPSRWEQFITAVTRLLTTVVDLVTNRFQLEVERARRTGEAFLARAMRALANTASNLGAALLYGLIAIVLGTIALVVLTVGASKLLDNLLGAPYGTLLVGAFYLLLALGAFAAARGRLNEIQREAELLGPIAREK